MIPTRLFILLTCLGLPLLAAAESMSLEAVLQRVVDHYPSIKSAALQVENASEENIRVEDQLTWQLNSRAAYSRDTSLFGTANDQYSLSASVNRNLESGGLLGLNASVRRDDAEDTFGPTVPNPATKTRVDVNYRHRFGKGAGNLQYTEGLESAEVAEKIAAGEQQALFDLLASQVVELYLSVATTEARILNLDKTIERGLRLQKYIDDEFKLGLSEEKDVLQVKARLSINEADKKSLRVLQDRQLISLNRLMGMDWQYRMQPLLGEQQTPSKSYLEDYQQATQHSAEIQIADAKIQLAESAIRSRRDDYEDELDLVLFIGNELNSGDTLTGELDESQVVGGVSLEFNRGLNKDGLDAALRQAHYERGIALQDKKQVLEDLKYDISSLLAEIKSSHQALDAFAESVKAERKKLDEALARYRDGRIETDRIIEFESQLSVSELSYALQEIELVRRYYQLELLRGDIWSQITIPSFDFDEYTNKDHN